MTNHAVTHNPDAQRFEIALDGALAIAEYKRMDPAILFTHTEVPEAMEGQGVGSALARAGLDYARAEGLLVVPLCPFFAGYMQKHPETRDLLHASYATLIG